MNKEGIYKSLKEHQLREEWHSDKITQNLINFSVIFNDKFDLKIPEIAIGVGKLRKSCYGHFRRNHNDFGLKGEIIINNQYIYRPMWKVLGTLLHEMLHAWQENYCKPSKRNYHNREFCMKADSFGLIVDRKGVTKYNMHDSPFLETIQKYGIVIENEEKEDTTIQIKQGKSSLKKWSCGCTNVRVGSQNFLAQCQKCGKMFKKCI